MKTRFPIIGFTGLAGAGKSTAADGILAAAALAHIPASRFSFAEPGKRMLELIGVPPRNLRTPDGKMEPLAEFGGKSGRDMMQTLMTEWGRGMVANDLWIRVGSRQMLDMVQRGVFVVVDDIRFDNEAEVIADLGGTIIEIHRPWTVTKLANGGSELTRPWYTSNLHASERGILGDWIDRYLGNDGTIADLHAHACAAVFAE